MKYFVIDPRTETIEAGTFHKGHTDSDTTTTLERLQNLVGCRLIEASPFTSKHDKDGVYHDLIVDEEGTFPEDQYFFWSKVIGQPLAGRAVVVGFDPETGEHTDCKLTKAQIQKRMAWMGDRHTTQFICQMLAAKKQAAAQ